MPTEAQLKEYCLDDFKLPSFIAQRRVRANGVVKCNIALGRCVYNKETKKRSIVDQKVVGVVEDNKEFGRIVFKEAFLEEYPVLRDLTVFRNECGKYTVVKAKVQRKSYQSTYLKTGPKRYNPNAGQPEDGASMKEAGTVFLMNAIAEAAKLKESVLEVFGEKRGKQLMDLAHSAVIDNELSYYLMAEIARNRMCSSTRGLSSTSLSRLTEAINQAQVDRFYSVFNSRVSFETDPLLDAHVLIVDGTSISTYSKLDEAKYGHNKDNDPIPQVNLLMITSDDGMPRTSYFHDGNIHDSVAFRGDLQDALNVLWANDVNGPDVAQLERTKFVWVFDRGFNVSPVMNSICESGNEFLGCLSINHDAASAAIKYAMTHNIRFQGESFSGEAGIRHVSVPDELCQRSWSSEGKFDFRIHTHVYYNELTYAEQLMKLNTKADDILIAHRQGTYSKLPDELKKLNKQIQLVQEIKKDGEVTYRVNGKAIHRHALEEAMWVIATSIADLDGRTVLDLYRKRNNIEVTFKHFKGLSFDRLHIHSKASRVGRGFVAVLCTMEKVAFLNRCYGALAGKYCQTLEPKITKYLRQPRKLLERIKSIKAKLSHDGKVIVSGIGKTERSIFLALGFTPPGGMPSKRQQLEEEWSVFEPVVPDGYNVVNAYEEGLGNIKGRKRIHA